MRVQGRDGVRLLGGQQSYNISQAHGSSSLADEQLSQWLAYFAVIDEELEEDAATS